MAFPAGSHATPVEVLHLAAWIDMVDLLTQQKLGEARVVWGLVVETLLCGVSPGMDEGWIVPGYRTCIQSHVRLSWSKVPQLSNRIGRYDVLSRAPWSPWLQGEDILPLHVRRLLSRLRLGRDLRGRGL